jgi:hypothetical protein
MEQGHGGHVFFRKRVHEPTLRSIWRAQWKNARLIISRSRVRALLLQKIEIWNQ